MFSYKAIKFVQNIDHPGIYTRLSLMSYITIQVQLNAAILLILIFIPKSFWSLGEMEKMSLP